MKHRVCAIVLGVALLAVAPVTVSLSQQPTTQPRATLKITTKLGIETTLEGGGTSVEDDLLEAVSGSSSTRIPLEISPGAYIVIPPYDLKEAVLSDSELVATLADGSTVRGRGVGSLNSTSGQSFGLNSVSRLTVVEVTKDYDKYVRGDKITGDRWRLTVGGDTPKSLTVRRPRFAFTYYSTAGYVMGGSTRTSTGSANFWLKKGAEEMEAPLEAFNTIRLTPGSQRSAPSITVTAPNGTTTTGELVLKSQDSKGWHNSHDWGLHAFLDGLERTSILVTSAPIVLERVP